LLSFTKTKKWEQAWEVRASFQLGLNKKDKKLIERIQSFFGVGKIFEHKEVMEYRVSSIKEIREVIIPYFLTHQLISQKQADFWLFKLIIELMSNREHLQLEGLCKIISIRAAMNWGLNYELKYSFPEIIPVPRPPVEFKGIPDPNWLSGFIEAEGNFIISISKSLNSKLGVKSNLRFKITQHTRDAKLISSFKEYFSCGLYYQEKNKEIGYWLVSKLSDIETNILPFFNDYPLQGVKVLDFNDFKKAVEILKVKGHLNPEGLEKLIKIKAGMNKGRNQD